MKTTDSNLKILHLLDILNMESDEEHILTMNDLLLKLQHRGIKAERKAVSRYIKQLQDFNYDISDYEENHKGYFMRERHFQDLELKFLIDAVVSARWLTHKKTKQLIEKLEGLTSKSRASKFKNQVYFKELIKCNNEDIYYNVDWIETAIENNKKISFLYYDIDINKNKFFRKEGRRYELSPYRFVWQDGFYYIIGSHDKYDSFSHYRIDRMSKIIILDEARKDIRNISCYHDGLNTAEYMKRTFKMFTGEEGRVELKFNIRLLNTVLDYFGMEVPLVKLSEDYFKVSVSANIGEGLIYWLLQFGADAEVLYPESLRDDVRNRVINMYNIYKTSD